MSSTTQTLRGIHFRMRMPDRTPSPSPRSGRKSSSLCPLWVSRREGWVPYWRQSRRSKSRGSLEFSTMYLSHWRGLEVVHSKLALRSCHRCKPNLRLSPHHSPEKSNPLSLRNLMCRWTKSELLTWYRDRLRLDVWFSAWVIWVLENYIFIYDYHFYLEFKILIYNLKCFYFFFCLIMHAL